MIESELSAGKHILFLDAPEAQTLTLRAALKRYRQGETVNEAGAGQERGGIARRLGHALADRLLHQIVPEVRKRL